MEYELTLGGGHDIKSALFKKSIGIIIKPVIPFPIRTKKAEWYYVSFNLCFPLYINVVDLNKNKKVQYQFVYSMDKHCFGIDVNQGNGFHEFHTKDFNYDKIIKFIQKEIQKAISFDDMVKTFPFFRHQKYLIDIYNKRKNYLKYILNRRLNNDQTEIPENYKEKSRKIFKEIGMFKAESYPMAHKDWLAVRGWTSFIYFAYPEKTDEYFKEKQKENPWLQFPSIEFHKYNKVIKRQELLTLRKKKQSIRLLDQINEIKF